jgi:hypothetical protein
MLFFLRNEAISFHKLMYEKYLELICVGACYMTYILK